MAAQKGAKVGLCELPFDPISSDSTGGLGGTCVIRGCVPKKLLVYGSSFSAEFSDAAGFGWDMKENPQFSWDKLLAAKNKEIQRLNGIYSRLLEKSGVDVHTGSGKLIDKNTVQVTTPEVFISNSCKKLITHLSSRGKHTLLKRKQFLSRLELVHSSLTFLERSLVSHLMKL